MKALTTTITAFLLTVATALSVSASEKPNVLFITSDDLGFQLSCYGDTVIETPHLDALAASGVQFDVAYVASGWGFVGISESK